MIIENEGMLTPAVFDAMRPDADPRLREVMQDELGLARLEAAILDGGRLAAPCLKWHSDFEE